MLRHWGHEPSVKSSDSLVQRRIRSKPCQRRNPVGIFLPRERKRRRNGARAARRAATRAASKPSRGKERTAERVAAGLRARSGIGLELGFTSTSRTSCAQSEFHVARSLRCLSRVGLRLGPKFALPCSRTLAGYRQAQATGIRRW